ncbi:hypothetical protein [Enterococcus plantarum]|uniref:hypothetical protein n=1 Tax=Enterococcus plantarum TaxID=1077675 RepID=UPI001F5F0D31|nr:hypothetical protein [Enterococcus plantarum]
MKKDQLVFKKGDLVHINDESYLFLVDYAEIENGKALYEMQSLDNSLLIQKQDIVDNNFVLYQPIANSSNSYENFSIQKNSNYNYYLLDSENKVFAESDSKEHIELILTYLKSNTIIATSTSTAAAVLRLIPGISSKRSTHSSYRNEIVVDGFFDFSKLFF